MKITKYGWGRTICATLILLIVYFGMGYSCFTWQYWTIWVLSWGMVIFTYLEDN